MEKIKKELDDSKREIEQHSSNNKKVIEEKASETKRKEVDRGKKEAEKPKGEAKKVKSNKEVYFITHESVFKNLKPSEHRYTFADKDEL